MVEMRAGEKPRGTEDSFGSALGDKKKQAIQPWAQGYKKPRTNPDTGRKEQTLH